MGNGVDPHSPSFDVSQDVDPVCGKRVDSAHALFRVSYETEDYLFCSQACMIKFKEDPERYVGEAED
jgi:YHS domain-containing protein